MYKLMRLNLDDEAADPIVVVSDKEEDVRFSKFFKMNRSLFHRKDKIIIKKVFISI